MRFFLMLRSLGAFAACLSKATGGAMPADHETIRIWGLSGGKTQDDFFLFREVLGGGGPGRPWADGSDVVHVVPNSRNLPAEFAETRYPVLVEQLGLKQDSGGAGYRRGGLGYDKRIRTLDDGASHLQCRPLDARLLRRQWRQGRPALRGGGHDTGRRDGRPSGHDRHGDRAGRLIVRIVTTGGGGWGDPLLREVEMVVYDVQCGLVSPESATEEYGVVLTKAGRKWQADLAKTAQRRRQLAQPARQSADVRSRPVFRRAKAARPGALSGGLERSGCRLVRQRPSLSRTSRSCLLVRVLIRSD